MSNLSYLMVKKTQETLENADLQILKTTKEIDDLQNREKALQLLAEKVEGENKKIDATKWSLPEQSLLASLGFTEKVFEGKTVAILKSRTQNEIEHLSRKVDLLYRRAEKNEQKMLEIWKIAQEILRRLDRHVEKILKGAGA